MYKIVCELSIFLEHLQKCRVLGSNSYKRKISIDIKHNFYFTVSTKIPDSFFELLLKNLKRIILGGPLDFKFTTYSL